MGKNVAVFVDVANIFYAAKAAGVDIDYVTLLKASSAGRDLVRAYAYTGLDPDNENQRNFHDFLRRHGYRVVSKDIRKYGDGKVKANLDIELVVDMMKTARNLDVAIVVSGDGDFAPAIRAVQEQGVRVEVVSFRGNTSSDLMDVADLFTDITQIARVEKGSSRSGRRVATADEDLSMTEVPDKQSEGSTERNRRGRSRRSTVATTTTSTGSRGRGRAAASAAEGALVALPGEKLSRAASAPEPEDGDLDEAVAELDGADAMDTEPTENGGPEDGRRRRRRRGGRGRGRGRGREEGPDGDAEDRVAAVGAAQGDEEEAPPPPTRRPASAFGSVWDSQIGIAAHGSAGAPVVDDDEDLEEPAVPEYLLAERRQRDGGRGGNRGGRGRGGAYAAALDRERFGGGRGSTPSRFGEPPPRREGAYGRPGGDRDRDRSDRQPFRQAQRPAPRPSGDEPWSEVPPEIEAMLRAQLGSRPAPARPAALPPGQDPEAAAPESVAATSGRSGSARRPSPRGRRSGADVETAAAESGADAAPVTAEAKPAARRTRRSAASGTTAGEVVETSAGPAPTAAKRATRASATRKATTSRSRTKASASAASGDSTGETAAAPSDTTGETAAPKRRTTRRKAEPAA